MTTISKADVIIPIEDFHLNGILQIPKDPLGLIIFVHGSGSSRLSSRNQFVANLLNKAKFATLLFDLLTPDEEVIDEVTREYRFNIELLTERLVSVTDWVLSQAKISQLAIGYFGASTGAAAALCAAAKKQNQIKAVVSRGGRPDLAGACLSQVRAPTLLIVGGNDEPVISMNENARSHLSCQTNLVIIPGATHLFEEPGALDEVSDIATNWFIQFLNVSQSIKSDT